jgi:HEAT repeat protein
LIRVLIANAVGTPELVQRYKVRATPSIIVNEAATLVGQASEQEIVKLITSSGEQGSLTAVLDSMIKAGRAEDAGHLICLKKQPQAILPLYVSKEFSVRLAALVAMEEALEKDPRSLDPIVGDLAALLFSDDVALRGDTAALLGKVGNAAALPALRKAAGDPDPDVREAAQEAIQLLEKMLEIEASS